MHGERRGAKRVVVGGVAAGIPCRILPGEDVAVLNFSPHGILVETRLALAPGRMVAMQVASAPGVYRNVDGRVIRCAVTALCAAGGPRFRAGILVTARGGILRELWGRMLQAAV